MSLKTLQFIVVRPVAPEYKRLERCWTEFTLGRGPCGLEVYKLEASIADGMLEVTQHAGDDDKVTEVKTFIYKLSDVVGRVTTISR